MGQELSLFVGTFTTLLAIINPFEALPVYLQLTAGSDVLVDANADFTKLDMKQVNNLHVHWGGQYAGVDTGRFADREGDPNASVYQVVSVLDKNRLKIRPAPKATLESVYSVGRLSYGSFRVGNVEVFMLDTRSQRDLHDTDNPNKPGISILITDHQVRETLQITDRSYVIRDGRVLCHGSPQEVLENPEARKYYFGEGIELGEMRRRSDAAWRQLARLPSASSDTQCSR